MPPDLVVVELAVAVYKSSLEEAKKATISSSLSQHPNNHSLTFFDHLKSSLTFNMPLTKYKAAAVTSEPCWFDLEAGIQKTIAFINEAGEAGCKLIAFPEVWIPGYPYWMWKVNYQQSLPMLKKYRENSLPIDSEEFRRIRRAARDNQM